VNIDDVSEATIGAAIEVHRLLGPGLLEKTYERCLAVELADRGLGFRRQVRVPIDYKGTRIDCGYHMDFVVEDCLVVEIKAAAAITPVYIAQVITYLKLADKPVGLLINFNVRLLKDGLHRLTRRPANESRPPPVR